MILKTFVYYLNKRSYILKEWFLKSISISDKELKKLVPWLFSEYHQLFITYGTQTLGGICFSIVVIECFPEK